MSGREFFISGIDTDCGKTYITGLLASHLVKSNVNVITAKLVQTGCSGIAEDILEHRKCMETELVDEDLIGLSSPYVFSFPGSPHLAAEIDNKKIDPVLIRKAIDRLKTKYELVLTEGAGGLMVPLTKDYLIFQYIQEYKLPLVLVSSSKLGSINHTLLSLELCKSYSLDLKVVIYNQFPGHDKTIAESTYKYLKEYVECNFSDVVFLKGEEIKNKNRFLDNLFV